MANQPTPEKRKPIHWFKLTYGDNWRPKWEEYIKGLPLHDFTIRLILWQGERTIAESAKIIGVTVWGYRNWFYGQHLPYDLRREQVEKVMRRKKAA